MRRIFVKIYVHIETSSIFSVLLISLSSVPLLIIAFLRVCSFLDVYLSCSIFAFVYAIQMYLLTYQNIAKIGRCYTAFVGQRCEVHTPSWKNVPNIDYTLYPFYTIKQTSSRHRANVQETSSKHRANIKHA